VVTAEDEFVPVITIDVRSIDVDRATLMSTLEVVRR
jgi:hypothetical protein